MTGIALVIASIVVPFIGSALGPLLFGYLVTSPTMRKAGDALPGWVYFLAALSGLAGVIGALALIYCLDRAFVAVSKP